ncbi:MAG: tRNA (adenosine(37)-N6)-threonylcarbamoyltransferase complex ATPase subunit type 1 TsaE [Candidatus Omnitrophota bacterium]|nr:tRNA (adenosine(37)-N6)-threonylcarbamoyltransferase complex ATPase subunit type 1 TsaE [Candidatus Omnitrophota bacterium]
MKLITNSAGETRKLAEKIARLLKGKEILCLFGQLGSGKTTFTKGLAKGMGIKSIDVNSPSFVLMKKYQGRLPLYHFDLYRIKGASELCDIGYEEFIYGDGVAVVEWAERMSGLLPKDHLRVEFSLLGQDQRQIKISAKNKYYRDLIKKL